MYLVVAKRSTLGLQGGRTFSAARLYPSDTQNQSLPPAVHSGVRALQHSSGPSRLLRIDRTGNGRSGARLRSGEHVGSGRTGTETAWRQASSSNRVPGVSRPIVQLGSGLLESRQVPAEAREPEVPQEVGCHHQRADDREQQRQAVPRLICHASTGTKKDATKSPAFSEDFFQIPPCAQTFLTRAAERTRQRRARFFNVQVDFHARNIWNGVKSLLRC